MDSPCNGLTMCSGSMGSDPRNDIPAMVREFGAQGRIHFAHVRNIKFTGPGQFEEAAHFSADGSLDLYEIMKAFYEVGFDGYIRPDHGRMIWDEQGRAGYGLYDRALVPLRSVGGSGQGPQATLKPASCGYYTVQ